MKYLCILLLLSAQLGAAAPAKRYLSLKEDADYYVGEGQAKLDEFKGDGLKALAAAKERARGALAASIRVRIISETSESTVSGPKGTSGTVESKSASLADVVLENVTYEDFVDFPEKGSISSLARVSKVDYRRQLAGKGPRVYMPEFGLSVGMSYLNLQTTQGLIDGAAHGSPLGVQPLDGSTSPNVLGLNLDLMWRGFIFGAQIYLPQVGLYEYRPMTGMPNILNANTSTMSVVIFKAGYEYTPWAWRVQPFVPLAAEWSQFHWKGYGAMAWGLNTGLGVRYWPNDSLALVVAYQSHFALTDEKIMDGSYQLQTNQPPEPQSYKLSGYDVKLGIQWSGF